jgi:polysaccharide pyruvyl transferase WcaK-like protein
MDYLGAWPLTEIASIVSLAKKNGKKIGCLGVGTETLLYEQSIERLREQIAPLVEHWTVRTDVDMARLTHYGVDERNVTVAADLAWLVSPADTSFGARWLGDLGFRSGRPLVGVNLTNDRSSREQAPELLSVVAEVLDSIIAESDVDVMLFPNEIREGMGFDSWALRDLLSRVSRPDRVISVPNRYWHPQQAMSFVACCTVTLTMRYHFALFSALQGVPFVSLSRLGKLADLCNDLDWPYQVSLKDARADNLKSMLHECIHGGHRLSKMLTEAAEKQVDRAGRNVRSLEVVLGEC